MKFNGISVENSAIVRRVVQLVCDLAPRPLAQLRIVDLACAHGMYTIELGHHRAHVTGIEGREEWLEGARAARDQANLVNVEFVHDDVRNLSLERYGEFDVVLSLGILYHLDAPDVFAFLERVAEVCRGFAIIETHIALTGSECREWRGRRYWGMSAREHPSGATPEEKMKSVGASLDNEGSFWLTRASLCNILRHVGFTSVSECRNPVANLYVGEDKEFKIWGNRLTLTAIKGRPVALHTAPAATADAEADWPEDLKDCLFEDWVASKSATPPDYQR